MVRAGGATSVAAAPGPAAGVAAQLGQPAECIVLRVDADPLERLAFGLGARIEEGVARLAAAEAGVAEAERERGRARGELVELAGPGEGKPGRGERSAGSVR